MSVFSASISPPDGMTVQDFASANRPVVEFRPGYRRSTRLRFGHDTVWVIASSASTAAAELKKRLGPTGAIHRGPAPLLQ